ncbi:hypothetical protein C0431_06925 [bacterium]|nr:hypothetical protein [bacterium]
MRKKAFTLIELLVVIAIIAILAAILFPVFAKAKEAAKKTQGLAQMKQIGTAVQIYMSDYDDGLPTWDWFFSIYPVANRPASPPPSYTRMWDALLSPYVKNGKPETQQFNGIWQSPGAEYAPSVGRSIVINQQLIWDITRASTPTNGGGEYVWPTGSFIDEHARTVFVADGGPDGRYEPVYFFNGYNDKWILKINPTRSAPWRYGGEGSNYVFCDSHAKHERGDKMYPNPGRNFTTLTLNNADRGKARCAAANFFAANESQRELLRTAASTLYGITCSN